MPTRKPVPAKPQPKKPAKPRKLAKMWLCRDSRYDQSYIFFVGSKPTPNSWAHDPLSKGIFWAGDKGSIVVCVKSLHRVLPARYRLKPGGGPIPIRFEE